MHARAHGSHISRTPNGPFRLQLRLREASTQGNFRCRQIGWGFVPRRHGPHLAAPAGRAGGRLAVAPRVSPCHGASAGAKDVSLAGKENDERAARPTTALGAPRGRGLRAAWTLDGTHAKQLRPCSRPNRTMRRPAARSRRPVQQPGDAGGVAASPAPAPNPDPYRLGNRSPVPCVRERGREHANMGAAPRGPNGEHAALIIDDSTLERAEDGIEFTRCTGGHSLSLHCRHPTQCPKGCGWE